MNPPCPPLPAADLEHVIAHTAPLWRELAGSRLFITGGTGFFGVWLLESIAAANAALKVSVCATVLSRDPRRFADRNPHLANHPEFSWLPGNPENFAFPADPHDYVFHLATPSAAEIMHSGMAPDSVGGRTLILSTLLGMERVLQFARVCHARRLLLASSGAVYGQPPDRPGPIPEIHSSAPIPQQTSSAYGEIKRMSELMCALSPEVECVIARGFSFFGPGLPLSGKFAIGSFIRDAIDGGPIRIHGDGTPVRSYLYAADLVIWLLTLLLRGEPNRPYNVGSDHAVSLANLANEVATASGGASVEIACAPGSQATDTYLPDIERARRELGLDVFIPRHEGLRRTVDWTRRSV